MSRRADTVLTPVDELSAGSLSVGSVNYDWSSGYPDEWTFVQVPDCPQCGDDERVNFVDGYWCCYGKDGDHEWGWEIEDQYTEGPMMNYYYPIDSFVISHHDSIYGAAMRLKGLPLCIVDFQTGDAWSGRYGLALTGGGMDLSWEICEAFMRLGELPPTHFADLPGMAGRPRNEVDAWIVRGCLRSFEVAHERAGYNLERASTRFAAWLEQAAQAGVTS